MKKATWIAVDWGTSNLRIWVFGEDDRLIDRISSDRGMGGLAPDQFDPILSDLVAPYLCDDAKIPVICCGMVGARQGWREAVYVATPTAPFHLEHVVQFDSNDGRMAVTILPGLSQAAPADVMRGEETQISGFLADHPDFFGTICLPGTHTKWVQISAQEIVSFRTFMSGEIFGLLEQKSVLRHSVADDPIEEAIFCEAVNDSMGAPQQFGTRLFGLRAEGLVHGLSASKARSRLSGYVIGLELAGARHYWLGQDLVLLGDESLTKLYEVALQAQGAMAQTISGDEMVLAGLKSAYQHLQKEAS